MRDVGYQAAYGAVQSPQRIATIHRNTWAPCLRHNCYGQGKFNRLLPLFNAWPRFCMLNHPQKNNNNRNSWLGSSEQQKIMSRLIFCTKCSESNFRNGHNVFSFHQHHLFLVPFLCSYLIGLGDELSIRSILSLNSRRGSLQIDKCTWAYVPTKYGNFRYSDALHMGSYLPREIG